MYCNRGLDIFKTGSMVHRGVADSGLPGGELPFDQALLRRCDDSFLCDEIQSAGRELMKKASS